MDGMECSEIFEKCPLILITGSTLANGTIDDPDRESGKGRNRVVFRQYSGGSGLPYGMGDGAPALHKDGNNGIKSIIFPARSMMLGYAIGFDLCWDGSGV